MLYNNVYGYLTRQVQGKNWSNYTNQCQQCLNTYYKHTNIGINNSMSWELFIDFVIDMFQWHNNIKYKRYIYETKQYGLLGIFFDISHHKGDTINEDSIYKCIPWWIVAMHYSSFLRSIIIFCHDSISGEVWRISFKFIQQASMCICLQTLPVLLQFIHMVALYNTSWDMIHFVRFNMSL